MSDISLCMIVGNEEKIILDCLNSAKASFDELCMVVAVGNRKCDATWELASEWCEQNGKDCRFDEYHNLHDFPHTDDFSAGRNLSFQLARKDWILWLDADDYLDDINCKRIREAVATLPVEVNGLFCNYRVEKDGGQILRERLIRKGHGHWKNPVHEFCVIDGEVRNCPQIEVFHRPHGHKHESSAKRNAAILSRVLEDVPRHYFYLQADFKILGDKPCALDAAQKAWHLLSDNQVEERYVVALNLSELDESRIEFWLHEAVRLQPHRREAFAYLCQLALIENRISDATSWLRIMESLPEPSPIPWTHQGMWYGWAGNFLRVRVLWARGQKEAGDKLHLKNMMSHVDYETGFKEWEAKQK